MNTITSLTSLTPFQIDGNDNLCAEEIIADFFSSFDLHETQNNMWEMIKLIYIGKNKYQSRAERQSLISFYEQLYDFLTQCYLSQQVQ